MKATKLMKMKNPMLVVTDIDKSVKFYEKVLTKSEDMI